MCTGFQNDVDRTADCILSVQGRSTFGDDFDMIYGAKRDQADIGRLGAGSGAGIVVKIRADVAPFAIEIGRAPRWERV